MKQPKYQVVYHCARGPGSHSHSDPLRESDHRWFIGALWSWFAATAMTRVLWLLASDIARKKFAIRRAR